MKVGREGEKSRIAGSQCILSFRFATLPPVLQYVVGCADAQEAEKAKNRRKAMRDEEKARERKRRLYCF